MYDFFTAELGRKGFSRCIAGENYNAQKLVERETGVKENAAQEGDVQMMAIDEKGNVVVDDEVRLSRVAATLIALLDGRIANKNYTFPILKHTPQVYKDWCRFGDNQADRSFVMRADKALAGMQAEKGKEHRHDLKVKGLMYVIQHLYQPEKIIFETKGVHAGHYVALINGENGKIAAAVDLDNFRSGPDSINGEKGRYNILLTAYNKLLPGMPFKTFDEYLSYLEKDPSNITVYDRSINGEYEAPEDVALSDWLSRSSSEAQYVSNVSDESGKVNGVDDKDLWDIWLEAENEAPEDVALSGSLSRLSSGASYISIITQESAMRKSESEGTYNMDVGLSMMCYNVGKRRKSLFR